MRKIHIKYKQETGKAKPMEFEIPIYRRKGDWIIEINDEEAMQMGCVIDRSEMTEYIKWLEDYAEELQKEIEFVKQKI